MPQGPFDRKTGMDVREPWLLIMMFFLVTSVFLPCAGHAGGAAQSQFRLFALLKTRAPIMSAKVKHIYPHDSSAFTQGLFFHEDYLYESTGLNGKSLLSKKELRTGKTLQEVKIDQYYFGEGAAVLKNRIYQLTWRNETLLVYDAGSLQSIRQMKYRGEGWGLATDGKYLLMSNGSSIITVRKPDTFGVVREIHVHDGDAPVDGLNELEFIKGEIWANIFAEDVIVKISPRSGKVTGWVDLSVLRTYLSHDVPVDVLNGIAYDAGRDRIFVTGKYWPKIFEIQLDPPKGGKP
ncbi:MAG: glutaminyl-peptide cyclotransferase [Deltaproteobacteria bacterium]|nr:glutaminyl-peptide cyclotransferase [Deltaproteobacteria bacterium]